DVEEVVEVVAQANVEIADDPAVHRFVEGHRAVVDGCFRGFGRVAAKAPSWAGELAEPPQAHEVPVSSGKVDVGAERDRVLAVGGDEDVGREGRQGRRLWRTQLDGPRCGDAKAHADEWAAGDERGN